MLPPGRARNTLCGQLGNRKSQRSTASGPQRLDIKHAKQQHFAKHIFSMFTKSSFSWYPFLDAVIYIEIVVNIYENRIKWKEIFTRLLSITFALVCNEDSSCRECFVKKNKKIASPDEFTSQHVTHWRSLVTIDRLTNSTICAHFC